VACLSETKSSAESSALKTVILDHLGTIGASLAKRGVEVRMEDTKPMAALPKVTKAVASDNSRIF